MQERVILHSDLNSFYASVECFYHPEIRNKPVAVGGDPELRHGIILAKNEFAKKYNIKTGEALWEAKAKCPDLVIVPPNYNLYYRFSQIARDIYEKYSNQVESFGLDECWIDVTHSQNFGDGEEIALQIKNDIKQELGITASVGVSFNKIFAKLGSDMQKPDGLTVISKDNYKDKIFKLPANELLNVGPATYKKLANYGILSIGDLANTDLDWLTARMGKWGTMLWIFANGLDETPVSNIGVDAAVKSIGNSTTAPRDLVSDEDIKITLLNLSESVSARMRELGFVCRTVQLHVRDTDLKSYERQVGLAYPNRTAECLADTAFHLFKNSHTSNSPVRSVGVRACDLITPEFTQLSIIDDIAKIERFEHLDKAVDNLRGRFGHKSVRRAIMLRDKNLSELDPKNDNTIHPIGYLHS